MTPRPLQAGEIERRDDGAPRTTVAKLEAAPERFRRYPEYKASGIEWLGDVPMHWEVRRLKYLATLNAESLGEDTDADREIAYVDIGGVDSLGRIVERETLTFASAPSRARRLVRDGDVIVSTVRTYLRSIAAIRNPESDLIVSTGFAVVRPGRGLVPEFAAYTLRAPYFIERVVATSKGVSFPAIEESQLSTFALAVPPHAEQRAIATYLDRETTRIDGLIAKKERLIELLLERRTALITRAVTKGLDPNVPMKDSGVEWLGRAPAHWTARRLRSTVMARHNGIWGAEPDGVNDLPCIRAADFDRLTFRATSASAPLRSIKERDAKTRGLRAGDLLIEGSGGGEEQPVGMVVLYDDETPAVCSNFVGRMTVAPGFSPKYLMYLHAALYAVRLTTRSIKQTTGLQNLDGESYLNEVVALAPEHEQIAIAAHLDRETSRIDALVRAVRDAIQQLKELRTAMITAVVTGRVDVREGEAS